MRRGETTGDIVEQDLPGIGRSYTVDGADGGHVTVVLHHTGRRDVYVFAKGESDEPAAVAEFSDDQARRLGSILAGAYFKPAVVERLEAVIGGLLIEWATVREDSPGCGRSLEELAVRRETKMTVAAIVHADHSTTVAPEADYVLAEADQLVVIGRPEDLPTFLAHVIT